MFYIFSLYWFVSQSSHKGRILWVHTKQHPATTKVEIGSLSALIKSIPTEQRWIKDSWSLMQREKSVWTLAYPSNLILIKTISLYKVGAVLLKVVWGAMFCWLLLKLVTDFAYYITIFCCISHAVFFCFWLWGVRGKALIIWPCADAPFAFLLIQALLETFEHRHSMLCVWTCENPYHCLIT